MKTYSKHDFSKKKVQEIPLRQQFHLKGGEVEVDLGIEDYFDG